MFKMIDKLFQFHKPLHHVYIVQAGTQKCSGQSISQNHLFL